MAPEKIVTNKHKKQGLTRGGGGPHKKKNQNLKTTDFVDMMILNVLRDTPFSRNQPLKFAGEMYIRTKKKNLHVECLR